MTNNPILDVAIANLHNNNRAISAEVQVKRLQERIDSLEDLLIRVSRMMSNNEMPDGYKGLQGDISKAIGGQRWA